MPSGYLICTALGSNYPLRELCTEEDFKTAIDEHCLHWDETHRPHIRVTFPGEPYAREVHESATRTLQHIPKPYTGRSAVAMSTYVKWFDANPSRFDAVPELS